MSFKALLLSFAGLALLFLVLVVAPPRGRASIQTAAPATFQGWVKGDGLEGKTIEIYINHIEQQESFRVSSSTDGKTVYIAEIPMENVPDGSTVIFKIDEQVYGIGILHAGVTQDLDLELDEQMR